MHHRPREPLGDLRQECLVVAQTHRHAPLKREDPLAIPDRGQLAALRIELAAKDQEITSIKAEHAGELAEVRAELAELEAATGVMVSGIQDELRRLAELASLEAARADAALPRLELPQAQAARTATPPTTAPATPPIRRPQVRFAAAATTAASWAVAVLIHVGIRVVAGRQLSLVAASAGAHAASPASLQRAA